MSLPHIDVCVCTYKRPVLLKRLLLELLRQETKGEFAFSVIVADNDLLRSAESIVTEMARGADIRIQYCVEPQQNIARARNKAVAQSAGDFVAFIDDDEFPAPCWLLNAYNACVRFGVDGVLGPVERHFEEDPPEWLVRSRLYQRPRHETGFVMAWRECRTGNVLLKGEILRGAEEPFRPEFRAGEDQDFFRRMIDASRVFIWCDEAVVYETVTPSRWKLSIMMKRALLRGATAALQPTCGARQIIKSLIAIGIYTAVLPFAAILSHMWFMTFAIKLCDHVGKVAAFAGLNPIKAEYITD
jgi:glycosyltransferase involved in cell wall biosynthesis